MAANWKSSFQSGLGALTKVNYPRALPPPCVPSAKLTDRAGVCAGWGGIECSGH